MSERGDYRAIYTVLPDSPEFQSLSPHAQLVWFHLKLALGPTGIDTMTAPEWQIAERSNLEVDQVRAALEELAEPSPSDGIPHPIPKAWLVRERNVLWLRNGLKYEPSRTLTNANHRTSVEKHAAGLPKLRIVNDFCAHYGIDPVFPELWDTPSPTPSPSKGIPDHGNGDGERKRSTETENGKSTPSPREVSEKSDPLTEWLGEHAELVADCPLVRDREARKALHAQFGPPEMRANAWKQPDGTAVPPDDRPRILAAALLGYAGEGNSRIIVSEFAGLLRRTIHDEVAEPSHATTGSPDLSHWED